VRRCSTWWSCSGGAEEGGETPKLHLDSGDVVDVVEGEEDARIHDREGQRLNNV
jgi:hypothetical protein